MATVLQFRHGMWLPWCCETGSRTRRRISECCHQFLAPARLSTLDLYT